MVIRTHTHSSGITVRELRKTFTVAERGAGVVAALRSTVRRASREVTAVRDVSFDIASGEFVAFLGPNGAGKTTTLKMLAGLLHPTSGVVRVAGHEPALRERALLGRLALVMGQRSQLIWDLPASDSFEVHRAIYRVSRSDFTARIATYVDLLDIGHVVSKPVRNLSLGERMKCELALALVHRPTVLFLDEPTIGLDTRMQRRIRSFLRDYAQTTGATILLTSHDMADVEELCERVIAINAGTVAYDGSLAQLAHEFGTHRTISASYHHDAPAAAAAAATSVEARELPATVVEVDGQRITLSVARADVGAATEWLLAAGDVRDLAIAEPPVETLVEQAWKVTPDTSSQPDPERSTHDAAFITPELTTPTSTETTIARGGDSHADDIGSAAATA